MRRGRRILAKLSSLIFRRRMENDLAREVASHLTLLEDDFLRRGMTPQEAKQAARRAYGSIEQAKELHRDERSFVWLDHAWQDLRHAYRSLAKSPGFVAVALLSLALGIGVNTAIFTLVNGILLKKLPVPDPERIVQVTVPNYPVLREMRRQEIIFADVIGFNSGEAVLDTDGGSRKVSFDIVSGSYFSFFGAQPAIGRLLDEEDDAVAGAHRVCVLSYQVWQDHFGGDPRVLDRMIDIDGIPLWIVGVARPDFTGPELQRRYGVWVPTALYQDFRGRSREANGGSWLRSLARLNPEISLEEAKTRLEMASDAIQAAAGERVRAGRFYEMHEASKGFDSWRSSLRDPLLILMGAVALVLLVACANLANLLLARMNERHQEFAVKLSLGISRGRLLRQLLIETIILTLSGGLAGFVLSWSLTRSLLSQFNTGSRLARALEVTPDAAVFLFALGACVLTALISGLYPAWRASLTGLSFGLKGESPSGTRRGSLRQSIILVQVVLSLVLLFGASLFTHSLRNLRVIDPGFDMDNVLSVQIAERGSRIEPRPLAGSPAAGELLARVRELPGVEAAAFSKMGIFTGNYAIGVFRAVDSDSVPGTPDPHYLAVGSGYFSALNIPFLRGRDFSETDRVGSPGVVIVNQRLASQIWSSENPIGKRVTLISGQTAEVIGLVGNTKYVNVREEILPIVYPALAQQPSDFVTLQIRFRGTPGAIERQIKEIMKSAAPDYQVSNAATMELLRDSLISQERLLAFLSSLFGVLGTVLALVGIYGLISYSVTRRTREVGIRMSVGAQRSHVLWLFLREAVMLLGGGVLLGLPLALMLARLLESLLYEVSTSDPVDMSIAVAVLVLGGLLASYIPGHRATRVNPVHALRHD